MALSRIGAADLVEATVSRSIRKQGVDVKGVAFQLLMLAALLFSLGILAVLLWTVLERGGSYLVENFWDFLNGGLSQRVARAGISQALRGSFWIAVCVVVVAFPLGIGAAVYLEEYAHPSRLTKFIEINIRNLAGVPSVVYGIFGLTVFVELLNGFTRESGVNNRTLLTAGLTMAVLVMPIVIITSAEAIRAVPQSLREGAFGAGATRWEVIRTQVLPYAAPGILTGTLLSLSRAIGEAAPLIVIGAATGLLGGGLGLDSILEPSSLMERYTAMPVLVSEWTSQPDRDFRVVLSGAAIIALMVFVLLLNTVAIVMRNRFESTRER
jgi:phosphate transport system permease protein